MNCYIIGTLAVTSGICYIEYLTFFVPEANYASPTY